MSAVAGTALSVDLPFASLLDPYRDQHSQFWTTFDRFGFAFLSIAIFWFVVIKHFLQSSYLVYAREIGTSHNTIETLNEKLTAIESKRPHFTIPYIGTAVTAWSDTVHFDFRFVNSGEAAAYNPGADVFACWVNEKDEAVRVDRIDSVKEVLKDQGFQYAMEVRRNNAEPKTDVLVILFEIDSRLDSEDGEICKNKPIWISWQPLIWKVTTTPTPKEVALVKPKIERLKNSTRT